MTGLKILAGVLVTAGLGLAAGIPAAEALRTFSEIPASLYAGMAVIPAMLAGQLLTMSMRKRSKS
jgi:hypothetical protein